MNIEDCYLDLDKVSKLENEDERKVIHDYYRDMLSYNGEKGREDMTPEAYVDTETNLRVAMPD